MNDEPELKPQKVNILGMELDEWKYKSCIAHFGVGDNWATLFDIKSEEKNKGHATKLLIESKIYYLAQSKSVGGSVALNRVMNHLYHKLGYKEYK